MDDKIIYIIVAIIWVVSSVFKAINKNAKKTQQPYTTEETEKEPLNEIDDFKKIMEEIVLGKRPDILQPQRIDNYVEKDFVEPLPLVEKNKYAAFEGEINYENNKYAKIEDTLEKNKSDYSDKNINPYENEKNTLNDEALNENIKNFIYDFDLRKAVIYSEILKRPHY